MRIKSLLATFLCVVGLSLKTFASVTSRAGLNVPDIGSTGWGTSLNQNWNILDSSMCVQGTSNAVTGTSFTSPITTNYLYSNLQGLSVAIGDSATLSNFRSAGYLGRPNVAIGRSAMNPFTDGGNTTQSGGNTGVGYGVCGSTKSENTCLGDFAGAYQTDGQSDIFIGFNSGAGVGASPPTHGTEDIFIGERTGPSSSSTVVNNAVAIGYSADVKCSNCFTIGGSSTTMQSLGYDAMNVGVGTDTPKARLHIVGDFRVDYGSITFTNAGQRGIVFGDGTTQISASPGLSSTSTWTGGNTFKSSSTFVGGIVTSSQIITGDLLTPGTSGQVLVSRGAGSSPFWAGFPIIQLPTTASETTGGSTTSGSFSDAGASISITPTSTSSKILIFAIAPAVGTLANTTCILGISGTTSGDLYTTTTSPARAQGVSLQTVVLFTIDSPGTTTTQTYKIRIASNATGTASFGGAAATGAQTRIMVLEIL